MSQSNESAQAADALRHSHDHNANNLLLSLQRMAKMRLTKELELLLDRADLFGLVITIDCTPLSPLAMGHYKSEISIRAKVVR